MSTTTTNLGLTKPAGTETVSLLVINGNYDLIDAACSVATSSSAGLMSATDKAKLDGMQSALGTSDSPTFASVTASSVAGTALTINLDTGVITGARFL